MFIYLISDSLEEVKCVLLFSYIYCLTPKSEYTPEMSWLMVLKLTLHKMTKYLLNLVKYAAKLSNEIVKEITRKVGPQQSCLLLAEAK